MKLFTKLNSLDIKTTISWQKAIKLGVGILVKNNMATQQLEQAILNITKKYGAYYVLEKGLALLHAPIDNYNKKIGISLLILPKNIRFNNENKWARIIITFSAIDTTSHIKYIKELGKIFTNQTLKTKLLQAQNLKEFMFILYNN